MFPSLAEKWWEQVQAQTPWKNFRAEDFARLKEKYGVGWVVLAQPGVTGIDCEFQNAAVRVCRLR
jgi:predicted TIM-barrel fold metal-dependent hydrolase